MFTFTLISWKMECLGLQGNSESSQGKSTGYADQGENTMEFHSFGMC